MLLWTSTLIRTWRGGVVFRDSTRKDRESERLLEKSSTRRIVTTHINLGWTPWRICGRCASPSFPGNPLWTWEFPPLRWRLCFESNPSKSSILARRLAVGWGPWRICGRCIYTHACMYACTYVYICIYVYIYIYIYIYTHTYIPKYHICMHMYIHTYIHTYMHTSLYIYMYTYTHTYIYIYIYIYIHT